MPANGARGEIAILLDGRERILCLTLGALAEIETALGAASLAEVAAALENPSADLLLAMLAALLKGGGENVSREDLLAARIDPAAASRAIGAAFRAACAEAK